MSEIIVDTALLREHAKTLINLNQEVMHLDQQLHSLYREVPLSDLLYLIQADTLCGYSTQMMRCKSYLLHTAENFDQADKLLLHQDPALFERPSGLKKLQAAAGTSYLQILNLLKRAEDTYDKLPEEIHITLLEVIPSTFQDIVKTGIDLVQGDLQTDDVLGILTDTLAESTIMNIKNTSSTIYLSGVAVMETMRYFLAEDPLKKDRKDREDVENQLRELDLLGAAVDTAESFIDQCIGGAAEVGFAVVGTVLDSTIECVANPKFLKKVCGADAEIPFLTPIVRSIDGSYRNRVGKSPGEINRQFGKDLRIGIDKVTDVISDTADRFTSALTAGSKRVGSILAELIS